jgi:hypothetical protein
VAKRTIARITIITDIPVNILLISWYFKVFPTTIEKNTAPMIPQMMIPIPN